MGRMEGKNSVFVAIESVGSTGCTVSLLRTMLNATNDGFLCGRVTCIWSSTRCKRHVHIRPEAAGSSCCSGWRAACSSGCTRSTTHPRRQVVRACLLAPCSLCASRSPQMRLKHTAKKCFRLLSATFLLTRNVHRGWDPQSFVLSSEQFSSCPLYNWTALASTVKRSRCLLIIIARTASRTSLPRIPITLIVAVLFDFVYLPLFLFTNRHT